jgi:zinc transport system permease protein
MEILNYEFMQNAIIAGILVSIASGIIGSLIVVNNMVFLSGGIAHTSYGGIGIALYFSFPIFLGASVFAIFSALLIAFITLNQKQNIDIFIGLIWAVGMAIGIIFTDLTPGYNVDLIGYLFGSILAVSNSDIGFMSAILMSAIVIIVVFYKKILLVSYDSEYAKLMGVNVAFFYTLILVLSALIIVISIKIVGLILVISLLTMPIYIAQRISNSLSSMMFVSAILSCIFTFLGLVLSYNYDLSSGASIVLVSAIGLILFMTKEKIYD